jgi:hypothetical protein
MGGQITRNPNLKNPNPYLKHPSPKNSNTNSSFDPRYPKLLRVIRVSGHSTRITRKTKTSVQPKYVIHYIQPSQNYTKYYHVLVVSAQQAHNLIAPHGPPRLKWYLRQCVIPSLLFSSGFLKDSCRLLAWERFTLAQARSISLHARCPQIILQKAPPDILKSASNPPLLPAPCLLPPMKLPPFHETNTEGHDHGRRRSSVGSMPKGKIYLRLKKVPFLMFYYPRCLVFQSSFS